VSASVLPKINTLIDVSLIDGSNYPSRVEDVDDRLFTVAAPFGIQDAARPDVGTSLELAWLRDGSRLAAPARFTGLTREQLPRWLVQIVGESRRRSRREYMRGGGGEPVRLTRTGEDSTPVDGRVIDISERSIRCRIRAGDFAPDESVGMAIRLGDAVVEPAAKVMVVRHNKETGFYDIVATYEPTETVSRTIRGYILRRQMEERRRLAEESDR